MDAWVPLSHLKTPSESGDGDLRDAHMKLLLLKREYKKLRETEEALRAEVVGLRERHGTLQRTNDSLRARLYVVQQELHEKQRGSTAAAAAAATTSLLLPPSGSPTPSEGSSASGPIPLSGQPFSEVDLGEGGEEEEKASDAENAPKILSRLPNPSLPPPPTRVHTRKPSPDLSIPLESPASVVDPPSPQSSLTPEDGNWKTTFRLSLDTNAEILGGSSTHVRHPLGSMRLGCISATVVEEKERDVEEERKGSRNRLSIPMTPQGAILRPEPSPRVDRVALQGWLTKQGKVVKNWKRRWFVLRGEGLHYFKTEGAPRPKGGIPLHDAIVEEVHSSEVDKEFCFGITLPQGRRTYLIYADSRRERDAWLSAIRKHMDVMRLGM